MNGKYPRYTLHFDEEHPGHPVFIRDDPPSNFISACIPGLPEQSWLRTITDLLLILALAGLTYIALNNPPGFWPGWLQTVAGAGFAIAAGYLAIRYYTLFIFLYLLGLCLVAGTSVVAFFWWIL